jgi:PAS domain S-box-containing protein
MKDISKILIVDDKPENIFSLKQILSETSAEIISASNGNEALVAILKHNFALAILDVQMPEMNGYELAELIRSEKKTNELPIIFVSAIYSSDHHVFKGYDSGAVDFLVKPFNAGILLSKVNVFIKLDQQNRRLQQSENLIREQYDDLKASELRFESLVNTVPDIVYRIDPEGNFTFVNEAIEKLGYNPKELIGIHFSSIILPKDAMSVSREEVMKLRQKSQEGFEKPLGLFDERRTDKRKTTGLEIRLIPKIGSPDLIGVLENIGEESIVVEVSSSGFYSDKIENKNKIFLGTVGVIRDITDRKRLEDGLKKAKDELEDKVTERTVELGRKNMALTLEIEKRIKAELCAQKAKEEWQEIFNAIGHMAMVLDGDHTILAVNTSTVKQLGKLSEELIGKKCYEVVHDADTHHVDCPARNISDPKRKNIAELAIESMGKSFIVSCTPIFDDSGTLKKIIHVMTDISERKRLEKDLIQAHKMEAIGTLAGGIAHDFNNILTSLLGYTQLILNDVQKGTEIEQDLNEVYKSGLRAKELVRQILTFARKSEDEKMSLRLDLVVKEVIKFIRSSIPTNIKIKDNVFSKSKVMANATQIHQVIMNLCTNANHAMAAEGGVLEITLKDMDIDGSQIKNMRDVTPGKYIELIVSDTGPGIPSAIMDRIFEPYFTTKTPEEGTGMGLAMVQGIVKGAKGMVKVESKINQGTTFKIFFPITDEEKHSSLPISDILVQGQGHVLLVDDEIVITKLGKRTLEHYGYKITTANNPLDALTIFSKDPDGFDLVVTDLTMPDMKGDRLIKEIQTIRPGTPCVLCTGYSKEIDRDTESIDGLKAILIKPIKQNEFISTIQHLLNKDSGNETVC